MAPISGGGSVVAAPGSGASAAYGGGRDVPAYHHHRGGIMTTDRTGAHHHPPGVITATTTTTTPHVVASNDIIPGGPPPPTQQPTVSTPPAPLAAPPAASYLSLNVRYPGVESISAWPPVYTVENFLSDEECGAMIAAAKDHMTPAPVVGPGNGEVSVSRTSSTCYLAREDLPSICTKVCALTGKPVEHLELPQVGRYRSGEFYKPHYDAFDTSSADGRRFAQNGGQRVATVLVYLNDVLRGGGTYFSKLGLRVMPRRGVALVFFPATLAGVLDDNYLHAAETAADEKWVSQIWIRQRDYNGLASVRIAPI
mmetsp:Transcript_23612/g.93613  ORF Transcript_23612/g.93613 Transcript_23612/m.93613 type:complete len:311 (+) Transcript_23612:266-1198(+)